MTKFNLKPIDCKIGLKDITDNSIDLCLTDPPYFLDGLDDNWDVEKIKKLMENKKGTITSMPKGMKFNPEQGRKFQEFYNEISKEIFRVLKPGGFFLSWSSPRLYHRLAVAVEDQGFEIRDMYAWIYKLNRAKAMSLFHLIDKKKDLSDEEKEQLKKELDGWKTPQIKSCIEPICFAQKPKEGTFLENWVKYQVGLVDMKQSPGDGTKTRVPANVMIASEFGEELDEVFSVPKPSKKEKGSHNDHISVKPIQLCEHLIRLLTNKESIVLDPFNGSGTTGIAAIMNNRNYIGFEINEHYYDISIKRYQDYINFSQILD